MSRHPPAVRILPMSSNKKWFRGRSIEDVQVEFFLGELAAPPMNGRYCYSTSGLNEEAGAVVLFQYAGGIIASAVFERNERFDEPEDAHRGALWFDVRSIRVFEPVGPDQLRKIWPDFRSLGQSKQWLDPKRFPKFEAQLIGVRSPSSSQPRS